MAACLAAYVPNTPAQPINRGLASPTCRAVEAAAAFAHLSCSKRAHKLECTSCHTLATAAHGTKHHTQLHYRHDRSHQQCSCMYAACLLLEFYSQLMREHGRTKSPIRKALPIDIPLAAAHSCASYRRNGDYRTRCVACSDPIPKSSAIIGPWHSQEPLATPWHDVPAHVHLLSIAAAPESTAAGGGTPPQQTCSRGLG